MKKFVTLIFLTIISFSGITQDEKNSYNFVAGYPNHTPPIYERGIAYNSAILQIKNDTLVEKMVLCDSMHLQYFMRFYPTINKLSMVNARKNQLYATSITIGYKHILLNTHDLDTNVMYIPDTLNAFNMKYEFFDHDFNLLINISSLNYSIKYNNFDIPKDGHKPRIIYSLLNKNGKVEISNPSHYRNVLSNGNSAGLYLGYNHDALKLQGDPKNNVLRIPSSLEEDSIFHFSLPKDVDISKHGGFLLVNNKNVSVLYLYEYTEDYKIYRIYNKQSKQWDKIKLGRGRMCIKNFGEWLVGMDNINSSRIPWDPSDKQPGQEIWSKERTKYSPSIYDILQEYEYFTSKGDMFLYNINSKKWIRFNTKQADSEILLLKNNTVYYRTYDKIYSAKIVNGKRLGEPKLIIQHKFVPAIHFMFISNN